MAVSDNDEPGMVSLASKSVEPSDDIVSCRRKRPINNEKDGENGEAIKVSVWTKLFGIAAIEGYH
jgi:hypothetical protein